VAFLLPRDAMYSADCAYERRPSECQSVFHAPLLCQNAKRIIRIL